MSLREKVQWQLKYTGILVIPWILYFFSMGFVLGFTRDINTYLVASGFFGTAMVLIDEKKKVGYWFKLRDIITPRVTHEKFVVIMVFVFFLGLFL